MLLREAHLASFCLSGFHCLFREYWGYTAEWKAGQFGTLSYVKPEENLLGRIIFPFPHQPSLRKQFYKDRMDKYIAFVRVNAFSK